MKTILPILFMVSLFLNPLYTQSGFRNVSTLPGLTSCGWLGLQVDKDTIVCMGYAFDSIHGNHQGFVFAKFDTLGNLLLQKIYFYPVGDYVFDVGIDFNKTTDGGYIFVGNKSIIDIPDSSIVVKLTHLGDIEWQQAYRDTALELSDLPYQIVETASGYLINGYYQSNNYRTSVLLKKINKVGVLEWKKKYTTFPNCIGLGLYSHQNNNRFFLNGGIFPYGIYINDPGSGYWTQPQINEIDSLGNILWSWTGQKADKYVGVGTPFKISDSVIMYFTSKIRYPPFDPPYQSYSYMFKYQVHFFNQNTLNITKIVELTDWIHPLACSIHSFTSTPDNKGYVFAGCFDTLKDDFMYGTQRGWIEKLDANADSLWAFYDTAHVYINKNWEGCFNKLAYLSSGSIIAAGEAYNYGPPQHWEQWLVKISPDGCLQNCFTISANEPPRFQSYSTKAKVYPNPMFEATTFEIPNPTNQSLTIEILDALGHLIKQETFSQSPFTLNRNHLTAGVYFYKIRQADGLEIATGKLILQ